MTETDQSREVTRLMCVPPLLCVLCAHRCEYSVGQSIIFTGDTFYAFIFPFFFLLTGRKERLDMMLVSLLAGAGKNWLQNHNLLHFGGNCFPKFLEIPVY